MKKRKIIGAETWWRNVVMIWRLHWLINWNNFLHSFSPFHENKLNEHVSESCIKSVFPLIAKSVEIRFQSLGAPLAGSDVIFLLRPLIYNSTLDIFVSC